MGPDVVPVKYITVWNGMEIESEALFDRISGEVFLIQTDWEREFIRLDDGSEYDVVKDGGSRYIGRLKSGALS